MTEPRSPAATSLKTGAALRGARRHRQPGVVRQSPGRRPSPFKPEKGAKPSSCCAGSASCRARKTASWRCRRVHQGDRRRCQVDQRVARRRAAQGQCRGQHQPGPGHVLGPVLAAAPVPGQVRRGDRRRQLPRQEIRRLGSDRRDLRQERRQVDRDSRGLQRQRHQLPPEHDREGGLQGDPEGHRRLPRADEGAQGQVARRAASRSAAPPATATPGCTGRCGRKARNLVDKNDKVDHQLAGDGEGARIRARSCRSTFVPGTASWNDAFNNKAFLDEPDLAHQQRRLDLRRRQGGRRQGRRRRSRRSWTT